MALLAGGGPVRAALLAMGMLGLQFCIGTVNDLYDAQADRVAKPWKPIAAGVVSRRAAWRVALIAGGGGLAAATAAGGATLTMAVAMLACGLVYDVKLKPTALAWACFSVAFTILPLYAWYGAAGQLPPRLEFLVPLAALAGPVIQLSNGLADLERDSAVGLRTLAARLGQRRTLLVVAVLLAVIHSLAWLTLTRPTTVALAPGAAASALALLGLALSAAPRPAWREVGWMVQACAVALLGLAWLWAVSA